MTLVREAGLRGLHAVAALLLTGPGGEAQAVAAWEPGATLLRLDDGSLVLRFRVPVWRRGELGAPIPLLDAGGRLSAVPLAPARLAEAAPGAVLRLRHGHLVAHRAVAVVDPGLTFDLSGWSVHDPLPPPAPPAAARVRRQGQAGPAPPPTVLALRPPDRDARAILGDRPGPTGRDRRGWRRLERPSPAARRAATRTGPAPTGAAPAVPLLDWLSRRSQARYLENLTRLFAAGDIESALRRAIPLGGGAGGRAARAPRPRRDLRIQPNRSSPASVVHVEPGLRAELEQRYRAAFERLEREGRIVDAAFVLVELLDRTPEACAFLERHAEVRLAAELAEARGPDQAEAVRLWWRAGDRDRAVLIARRHGCFAPAILRLERRGDHGEAGALRQEWMTQLLEGGDLVAAYDVGAEVDTDVARAVRRRLVKLGVEHGGPLRAQMLARQLRAGDDAPHPALAALVADPAAAADRRVLTAELARSRARVDHPTAVRALLRRLLVDEAPVERGDVDATVALADDPVLRTDLPRLSLLARPRPPSLEPLWVDLEPSDRGHAGAHDARLLPGGRVVVAVDGAGVRILRPDGRTEAELDVPAHVLIPSDNGLRLLAVRVLGPGAIAVATVAVPERKARAVGEIAATAWADGFDGGTWFLADHSQLWMLDMLAGGPSALWRQEDHRQPILAIARSRDRLAVAGFHQATADGPRVHVRRYGLPALVGLGETQSVAPGPFTLLPSGAVVPGQAADGIHRVTTEGGGPGEVLTVIAAREGVEAPVAVVRLGGATRAAVHLEGAVLLIADDRGRIERLDLAEGRREPPLRITF